MAVMVLAEMLLRWFGDNLWNFEVEDAVFWVWNAGHRERT